MSECDAVLREIEAVLLHHRASLFFEAPARLWIKGEEVAQVMDLNDSEGQVLSAVEYGAGEPQCAHHLCMPESTLTVIDPYKAKCDVCYEFFDLSLRQSQATVTAKQP